MSVEELYAEMGIDFRPEEREGFLRELAATATSYRESLGGSTKGIDERDQLLQDLANELGKEVLQLSPRPAVVALGRKRFKELGIEIPSYIADLLKRFDFYLVQFPVTVVPRPGWGFSRLDCAVEFNPGLAPEERPVAFQVFPQEEWQKVIQFSQQLQIGLDENLEFKVDPAQAAELAALGTEAKAAIGLQAAGKAGLVLGPFEYQVRRPRILSRGKGNVKVYWRMEGEERVMQEEPRLGVVLQVPKGVARVDAIGAVSAFRSFDLFTADLRYVWDYLSQATKSFFRKGAPAVGKQPWDNITAGVEI
jgi:hypothetical protein